MRLKAKNISAIQNFKIGESYPILRFMGRFGTFKLEPMIELYEPDNSQVIECLPVDVFKKHFKLVG